MAEREPTVITAEALEALQMQTTQSRRARPPDLDEANGDENRVPLKPERLQKRESRIGLRGLFGRSKASRDAETPASTARDPARPGGIRSSLAEISNWPYGLHGARSELSLPSISQQGNGMPLKGSAAPRVVAKHSKSSSGGKVRASTAPPKSTRGALATWDPPPLFQAYPQAIKHAQLPACTVPVETLLRMSGSKGGGSIREDLTSTSIGGMEAGDDGAATGDKGSDGKAKRRHRRNTSASSFKFDWTTKIFVLVTSGYLLQYSGEGSFDRLPEKMLHLGKDSAAFASDAIPGKHWVLQVTSAVTDPDGLPPASDASSRASIFSRLPFRGSERRSTSNFLMVFESAEDMESWITTLRREIEALGGKKTLSETGRPRSDEHDLGQLRLLRAQPSQRTLVVRDPDRFSRAAADPVRSEKGNEHDHGDMHAVAMAVSWGPDGSDSTLNDGGSDDLHDGGSTPPGDHSADDVSTTTSVVSHDGHQLESLRDSVVAANRLSYISSGQRTIITSEGSVDSPACSPTRDSFGGGSINADDSHHAPHAQTHGQAHSRESSLLDARPRPNAAAISERRRSMQTMNSMLDVALFGAAAASAAAARPHSASYNDSAPPPPATTPNFSVPHSVSKRYSLVRSPPPESSAVFASIPYRGGARDLRGSGIRKPPPTSLEFSRPLSTVADQPSPAQNSPQLGSTADSIFGEVEDRSRQDRRPTSPDRSSETQPSMFTTWVQDTPVMHQSSKFDETPPSRRSTGADTDTDTDADATVRVTAGRGRRSGSPRKHASMQALRTSDHFDDANDDDVDPHTNGGTFFLGPRALSPISPNAIPPSPLMMMSPLPTRPSRPPQRRPSIPDQPRRPFGNDNDDEERPRWSRSSLDTYATTTAAAAAANTTVAAAPAPRSRSPLPRAVHEAYKRASLQSQSTDRLVGQTVGTGRRSSRQPPLGSTRGMSESSIPFQMHEHRPPSRASVGSASSSARPALRPSAATSQPASPQMTALNGYDSIARPESRGKALASRRSMPVLADGPPPAPPPTCALPPIPRRLPEAKASQQQAQQQPSQQRWTANLI